MISIKQFWDGRSNAAPADERMREASLQLRRLLEGVAAPDLGTAGSELTSRDLLRRLEAATTPLELLGIANQALEAIENYTGRRTEVFREQSRQMQSMVAMLTQTLAEISGQSDASVAQLHAIERQIERASGLEDIRALRESLATCLTAVKEAAAQQRSATLATVERLRDHIKNLPQPPARDAASVPEGVHPNQGVADAEYVAAFKLQRADQILTRFGEGVREQMLALIGKGLKAAQGPNDRMMRWKGPCFVIFLNSPEGVLAIRRRFSLAVAKIGQNYVEAGKNSALLAVGVDWAVYPQAQYPSLDVVLAEVDLFLGVDAR